MSEAGRRVVRSLGVLAAGRVLALWAGVFYLVLGLVYAGSLVIKALVMTDGDLTGALVAALALVVAMPLVGSLSGLALGILGAFVYNLVSKLAGGFEIEID